MRPVWISMVLLGLSSLATASPRSSPADAQALQNRVVELVNRVRAQGRQCGRERFPPAHPLTISRLLHDAATAHASDMARRNYFDHHAPDGSEPRDRVRRTGYRWTLIGENIAFGPESAEEAVAGWLASPGHCANIMDPRFRDTGVALGTGRKRGHLYWVQEFGQSAR